VILPSPRESAAPCRASSKEDASRPCRLSGSLALIWLDEAAVRTTALSGVFWACTLTSGLAPIRGKDEAFRGDDDGLLEMEPGGLGGE